MNFKELVICDGGVFYKNIVEIKKELEDINKEFISKNISVVTPLHSESLSYCFDEDINGCSRVISTRDCKITVPLYLFIMTMKVR